MSAGPLDLRWTAPISKDGTYATYLELAGSNELLGTGNPVKVSGTLDGHPFEATLMPSGHGLHWLPLRKALQTAIGKSAADEPVEVHLTQRRS